jgi:peptidyl-prolyl cis-trans isomerase D
LLESFRKGQRWLTFIFVGTIGLVFVFFFGTGGGLQGSGTPTGDTIIELDDLTLTSIDFAREKRRTEDELRARLGDAYDEVGADRYVDSQALNSLLSGVVSAAAAQELGLHVTKNELRQVVQSSPSFIDDQGRFDPEAFDYFARREYGNQRLFIQSFTRQLLQQKLYQLLVAQTDVSDAEIDLLVRYEGEEVRIAYVAINPNALPTDAEITDAEIEAYATEHESDLTKAFESRAGEFATPARVAARHILIRVDEGATEEAAEEARNIAKAVRERIAAGEDFAAVAKEVSQDEGTAAGGGDLGTFAHGRNDAAIDDTAFALEAGDLSEVIRSSHGFHVLRVDEKLEAESATFENVRSLLASEALASTRAADIANERIATLAAAVEGGTSLEDAARELGLTLERPAALKRRADGYIAGLGAAPEIMGAAFGLSAGESSAEVYDVAGQRVLIQVVERTEPSADDIALARIEQRERLRVDKQNRTISAWLDDYRRRLEKSGRLRINAELALGNS